MGSASGYPFSVAEWTSGTRRVLDHLSPAADKVFVIRGTPELGMDGPNCLSRREWRARWGGPESVCGTALSESSRAAVYESLIAAATSYANVTMLDLNPLVCPDQRCEAERDGEIVFRDNGHLSTAFVKGLAGRLAALMNVPEQ